MVNGSLNFSHPRTKAGILKPHKTSISCKYYYVIYIVSLNALLTRSTCMVKMVGMSALMVPHSGAADFKKIYFHHNCPLLLTFYLNI